MGQSDKDAMSYIGTVTNGVVVLPADARLENGTKVRVEALTPEEEHASLGQRMMKFAGIVKDLPVDVARNHDHYLHRRPKK